MFENVLGQSAVIQLAEDIKAGTLAPSLLFSGPPASGKGTAALELGRILSCEQSGASGVYAPWNCGCRACSYHRTLSHPDLLILGSRPFSAEIAAAAAAFLRERDAPAVRMLFIRSVRKLLVRFSPVLWEDDPKIGKLSSLLVSLEEDLDEIGGASPRDPLKDGEARKKLCDSILKNALKLEAEGVGELIPIVHIRRAAYWSRLAPLGKRKLLLIENADRMQEGGRNSLLKILEEPPASVNILLSTSREESLLPTIMSRLRPYRFKARDGATEAEVIRRVFRDSGEAEKEAAPNPDTREGEGRIMIYLDSFLPLSGETLYPLAALFAASLALAAVMRLKRARTPPPPGLIALGKYTVPLAEAAGQGRPPENPALAAARVLKGTGGFEVRSRFSQFLRILLSLARKSFRDAGPGGIVLMDVWRRRIREAETAVGIYNQNPALALDRLCAALPGDMAGAFTTEYPG
ncbi:MAG: DNA polymerase III [Treponema sp.]|jgi:DNA polymerase-3 subunit gamma/tau|nr:DNA polymerase III [Treponema sp.]